MGKASWRCSSSVYGGMREFAVRHPQSVRLVVPILAASSLLWGCSSQEHAHPAEGHTPHWSYSGSTGPAHWGSLSPEYILCSTGQRQSPIDITTATPKDLPNITFSYGTTPLAVHNNGHTVQVDCAPGSFIELEGERYQLAQFHFHLPSEHTLKGSHAAGEMHLVHKSASGRLAVVGVMLREGPANPAFEGIASILPDKDQKSDRPGQTINLASLLPADQRTYRYDGSLTTPPGTEGVRWNLMIEPVSLSAAQIGLFRQRYHANNRPVQKLHGREVVQDTSR